jgi:membrane peptidoglycan carboxypeptidase
MTFDLLVLGPELLALLALALALLVHRWRARRAERALRPAPGRWAIYLLGAGAVLALPATVALFWPATRVCWKGCGWSTRYERLTRNGAVLSADSQALATLRRPAVVPVSELPAPVVSAFVVTEDARFPERRLGIDLRGTSRSLFHDLVRRPIESALGRGSPLNGGSTVEMQTVRLLPGDPFGTS